MSFFDEIARRKIEEALESGEWENLPNKGQPLDLTENPDVPEHLRLGHKILRDANVLPDWIQKGKDINGIRSVIEKYWAQIERDGMTLRAKWRTSGSAEAGQKYFQWRTRVRSELQTLLTKANSEILTLNLKAPRGYRNHVSYRITDELARFDRNFPE